jgi:hypothetical protein
LGALVYRQAAGVIAESIRLNLDVIYGFRGAAHLSQFASDFFIDFSFEDPAVLSDYYRADEA